jgi:hypothetical protein
MIIYLISRGFWSLTICFALSLIMFVVGGTHPGWELFFENVGKAFFILVAVDLFLSMLGVGKEED